MPINDETRARIELLVGIDKASYRNTRNSIDALFKQRQGLKLDEKVLTGFAEGVRKVIENAGKDADKDFKGLTERFDRSVGDLLHKFTLSQEELLKAIDDGNEARVELLIEEQKLLKDQIDAEADAHKNRLDAARKLQDALKPDPAKTKQTADALGNGFLDTIEKAKAKDLVGFARSLMGGASQKLGEAAKKKEAMAAAADSAAAAEKLSKAAAALSAVASGLAIAGAALVAVVALLKAADDQARAMNKTLLEGASAADFAFKGEAVRTADVTANLDAARKASFKLAGEFRGQADEFAGILAQLNQAGLSYKEMGKAARAGRSEVDAMADAARQTFTWSKAMGLSINEAAEAQAEWSKNFGSDFTDIDEKFASIQAAAMQGGFNVKRFFTAVSQATAGMAIYNIRMEEAAILLSKTSKILGDTDASDFIRSLTQGFADESITDRMKRIMIAGGKDTQRIFQGTADRTAKSFVDTFKGTQTGAAIEAAVAKSKVKLDIANPDALKKSWKDLGAADRRLLLAELRRNGDEQLSAAARQLETLGLVVDAVDGGLSEQVRGLAALDMQGKLAYKLQTLGDRRLNEMSSVELAAFEQYSGIGGAQLEQLMRVENQLMDEFELAKKEQRTTAKSFQEYIATNEEAAKKIEETNAIADQATWFARSTVKNTRSMSDVLQNTIASILNDIYGLMGTWFASSKSLSKESIDKQARATAEINTQREAADKRLLAVGEQLAQVDETIATTGKDSQAHQEALAKKGLLEAEERQLRLTGEYLSAQSRQVLLLDEKQMSDLQTPEEVRQAASEAMFSSGEMLDIARTNLSPEAMSSVLASQDVAARSNRGVIASQRMLEHGLLGKMGLGGALAAESLGLFSLLGVQGPEASVAQAKEDQAKVIEDQLFEGATISEEQAATLTRQEGLQEKTSNLDKKAMAADKKFQEAFPEENRDSTLDAMKLYEGWRLGIRYGLTGDDLAKAAKEWASGDTALGKGKLSAALGVAGVDAKTVAGGPVPQDFIMRPGQPLQAFSPNDTVFGMKPGGPISQGGGGGGQVVVNVYGGDQAKVYQTVKSALKNSGLRP